MDPILRLIDGSDDGEQPVMLPRIAVLDKEGTNTFQTDLDSYFLRRRIIRLYVDVNEISMADLQAKLQYLEAMAIAEGKPDEPIFLYINSPGGSVIQALSAYDTISALTCPVYTVVNGYAASAGSLLAQAGAPGHRYILPNAKVMLHELSGGSQGKLTAMNQSNVLSNHLEENLEQIYAHHTGRPITEIRKWLRSGDRWLTAADAVAHNLADEIITTDQLGRKMTGLTTQTRLEPAVKRAATKTVTTPGTVRGRAKVAPPIRVEPHAPQGGPDIPGTSDPGGPAPGGPATARGPRAASKGARGIS